MILEFGGRIEERAHQWFNDMDSSFRLVSCHCALEHHAWWGGVFLWGNENGKDFIIISSSFHHFIRMTQFIWLPNEVILSRCLGHPSKCNSGKKVVSEIRLTPSTLIKISCPGKIRDRRLVVVAFTVPGSLVRYLAHNRQPAVPHSHWL